MPATCRSESDSYRTCLKDARSSGRKCTLAAKTLEACRAKVRKANNVELQFDGTRVLPNPKCQSLNAKVQKCMKWKKADESQCTEPIKALKECLEAEQGVVAAPTAGDKLWSDYKGPK